MVMTQASLNADFWVQVKHRQSLPKRYTWEIHRKGICLSVEESRGQFGSWEEASQAGKKALNQFLQAHQSAPYSSGFFTTPPARRHIAEDWDLAKPEADSPEFQWRHLSR